MGDPPAPRILLYHYRCLRALHLPTQPAVSSHVPDPDHSDKVPVNHPSTWVLHRKRPSTAPALETDPPILLQDITAICALSRAHRLVLLEPAGQATTMYTQLSLALHL